MDWIPFFAIAGGVLCATLGFACGYLARSLREQSAAKVTRPPEREPAHALSLPPQPKPQQARARVAVASRPPSLAGDEVDATQTMTAARKSRRLLAAPPTIDGVTLRDYLVHYATRRCPHLDASGRPVHAGTWPCVVEDLYTAALASSLIAPYFDDLDAVGLAELKGHFLSALTTVTGVGLYLDVAERLEERHEHLGITEPVFDAVTGALVQSIAGYATQDVMNHVLPQMSPLVRELRGRLVTA